MSKKDKKQSEANASKLIAKISVDAKAARQLRMEHRQQLIRESLTVLSDLSTHFGEDRDKRKYEVNKMLHKLLEW